MVRITKSNLSDGNGKSRILDSNRLQTKDSPFHSWYQFILCLPPHVVRHYIHDFKLRTGNVVLDPFCGTGTTLLECKSAGIESIGLEANPFAHFASSVKTDWDFSPKHLRRVASEVAERAKYEIAEGTVSRQGEGKGSHALEEEMLELLIRKSISRVPLRKALILRAAIDERKHDRVHGHLRLAFAKALVESIGNLRFGPEIGATKAKRDAPVVRLWLQVVESFARDVEQLVSKEYGRTTVYLGDAREPGKTLSGSRCIDAVITSPPYPNEKDYTRTTRLESVLLGFITSRADLRTVKENLMRSNTRNVFYDDDDDEWVLKSPKVQALAERIEQKRKRLKKNSGFERLYARLTRLYFGGIARHLSNLQGLLKPGAKLAYVLGDQSSYLRVLIKTGELVGELAQDLGYELVRQDPFRHRFATATRRKLSENVIVLRWPG